MFWFAFNTAGLGEAQTYYLGVVNEDEGISEALQDFLNNTQSFNTSTLEKGFAYDFIEILNTTDYPVDEGEETGRIFNIREFDNRENGIKAVESRGIDAIIIFPKNYSNTTLSAVNQAFFIQTGGYLGPLFPKNDNSSIIILGDESYSRFQIANAILIQFMAVYIEAIQSFDFSGGNIELNIESIALIDYSVFDTIIPGILIFAVLSQASMLAAFLLAEITESGTIARVRLSLIKPSEYITGVTLFTFCLSFIQLSILMAISIFIFGFTPTGSIIDAMIVLILSTIFSTALGFIFAGIFKSSEAAGQSAGFVIAPLAFMSGAFMETPTITLIPDAFPTASGIPRDFILWDLLPSTHAMNALRSILLNGFTIVDVWADVSFILIAGLTLLALSTIVYNKRRFSGDIS